MTIHICPSLQVEEAEASDPAVLHGYERWCLEVQINDHPVFMLRG